ncbi:MULTISPECIES: metal-dependent transcriptional regulator [Staphylococcus]|uniref:Manganese transport regulator n=1 Tax=Staphylococcus pettenkoferi TaxID=170573 RepID=A0A2N6QLV1_9STAP|nr:MULTISPECIES: metal-dependent transcriptional regulator [Staphylococcus]MBX8992912.1 metal-dependent transcriptional regulator [Staphylococcus pettenkoferi]MCI2790877.1 metal-dependent transcriptional regulator [Staphylococcus pettenkoferi]MCY1566953.1 metal-dependent transcriptional regulator [Staphylococcus pettenkoferi]MCY1587423.1 metal-dependent transcriptional regulator [Staphylococcus pettenkoferi]MCY1603104.1 metal-dependent transcriptional regulator [Staphylococcus pettenkoferi]
MLTEEKEDYLKAILTHHGDTEYVTNKMLSQYLNIKPPSVSEMLNRLEKSNYVETKPYKGVRLTDSGLTYTLDIIKRHRLIELFLIKVLDYNWEEVHQEAEILEHRVSHLFVERLDKVLDYPKTCPHGGVIPRDNQYKEIYTKNLIEFDEGSVVTIERVRDRTELLIYLSSKEISIGDTITIESKDDTNNVIIISKGDISTILSYDNAKHIYVEE